MKCVGVPEPPCSGNDVTVSSGLCKPWLSSYSIIWKGASGKGTLWDLILMKRGESFSILARWERDAQGQVKLGLLKPPPTLGTSPEGQCRHGLYLGFLSADVLYAFVHTQTHVSVSVSQVKTESHMLQDEFQSRMGSTNLGSPRDYVARWPCSNYSVCERTLWDALHDE